jgi:hypothetical protein
MTVHIVQILHFKNGDLQKMEFSGTSALSAGNPLRL